MRSLPRPQPREVLESVTCPVEPPVSAMCKTSVKGLGASMRLEFDMRYMDLFKMPLSEIGHGCVTFDVATSAQ